MFENETQLKQIKELAEGVVLAEAEIERLEQDTAAKKEALITLMQQAGHMAVKLDSGLCPRLETKQRIGKKKDADNETMFEWLSKNGLGDIIKPAVHAGTLQTALEAFTADGKSLPEKIFNQYEQTVVRFGGKTKFLDGMRGER